MNLEVNNFAWDYSNFFSSNRCFMANHIQQEAKDKIRVKLGFNFQLFNPANEQLC